MYKGTLALPDRGSGGRQRGLGGHENFADRDLEEKWPKFFLFVSGLVLKAPVLGPFRGSQGVLCATYGRYVHIVEVIWARDEVLCWKARFSGDFSTVYSPEAPLCPPSCHTPATTPVPWPRRCIVVALWWPGRALGLRCGLLKAKNTRFSGISMFFWKNGLLKALFLKNKYWIRFIHAILLQKKVLTITRKGPWPPLWAFKGENTRFGGISMFFWKNGLSKVLFFEK